MTDVTRVLAPNPGIFTGPGTNTYVLAVGDEVVVIDPGPVIEAHLKAIEATIGDRPARAILVTHHHPDHAPAANPLGEKLDAPVMGYEKGPDFDPEVVLRDGDAVALGESRIVAVHTPGHTADHLCFLVGSVLFTGDHIMGGSTVVIEDAAAYMASLQRVLDLRPAHLYPGHGADIPDAEDAVRNYIEHRQMRERQVLEALAAGARTVGDIVALVYADVDPTLHFAAAHQVDTMLAKLAAEGRVVVTDTGEERVVMLPEEPVR